MSCKLVTIREQDGWNVHRCEVCGRECKSHNVASKTLRQCVRIGLGDIVAAGLRMIGFRKKCGGCSKRQEALNELGKKVGF